MADFNTFLASIGLGEFQAAKVDDFESLRWLVNRPELLEKVVPLEGHREELISKLKEHDGVILSSQESNLKESIRNPGTKRKLLETVNVEEGSHSLGELGVDAPENPDSPPVKQSRTPNLSTKGALLGLLEKTAEGKYLKNLHCTKGLDNKARLRLASLVINEEYASNTNTVISTKRFIEIASSITEVFYGELEETYYIPAYTPKGGKTVIPKGKLYDKYCNVNKDLREVGLRELKPLRVCVETEREPLFPTIDPDDVSASLKFLKTNLNPWDSIIKHWKATTYHRLNEIIEGNSKANVADYFQLYPCLKLKDGYTLLEHDFDTRFPESRLRLYSHWEQFSHKVRSELEKRGISAECDVEVLRCYVELFSVIPIKTTKKPWRANRPDIVKGFLHLLKKNRDLDIELQEIQKQAAEKGITVQPFPLLVGNSTKEIETSYVILNGVPVRVESPLRAVEVAFKCYFALNCKYPPQSERQWVVLQKTLFNVHLPSDRINPIANLPEIRKLVKTLRC